MTNHWETSLPDSLKNPQDLAKIRQAVTQWSQLVAWSWTPLLAFDKNENKGGQERTLKSFFRDTVQKQGQNSYAYESYGDLESKAQAELLGSYYKYLLLGENSQIPFLQQEGVNVTLSDVLDKLSGETYVFTADPDFTQMFTFRVVTDYTGLITQAVNDEGQPIPNQYISLMAYPPRPALSEFTVTEQQLYDWAENINTGGSYLPPSVYIPIAGS
ncbi:hypothetical protein [Spirulina sp. 06S082]|uniref:hypothetical protein n=1 Tax=Spirulina sp. 06S082 TaxID=3110248 RepID=UPI002B1F22C2|nr:hypothetical protein [Spirulina sp. 06S082]MEA5472120.1 hypothetical protein [Spirulina sp. 06S082]